MNTDETRRRVLSTPVTHTDWILHEEGPRCDRSGVEYMLRRCAAFGIRRVYWRALDGRFANYPSRLVEPGNYARVADSDQYGAGLFAPPPNGFPDRYLSIDHQQFDSIEAAIEIGRRLGIEIHLWVTINEDEHGAGIGSRFSREHPECRWVARDGRRYRSQLSFAFPEVREYKLGLVRELLRYEPDGLFLDWIRTGDVRDNPQADSDGWADFGYEEPNLRRFREQYGVDAGDVDPHDARWLACRAEPVTAFMERVRADARASGSELPVTVMTHHPWSYRGVLPGMDGYEQHGWMGGNRVNGSLAGLLCDVRTWAERDLIDGAVAAGYYVGEGNAERAHAYLKAETGGRVPIVLYCWMPKGVSDFHDCAAAAERAGAQEMLFWEGDFLDGVPVDSSDELATAMVLAAR